VYGDPRLEHVLAGANALDVTGGSAIVPGMRLEIPAPAYHRVVLNETWYELALAWLGDTKRADVLANANRAQSWVPPEEGREIVVPAVLSVIAGDNENDMTIAGRYLGDVNKAWIVDAYNFRKTGPFRRGEVVLVALPDLTLTVRGKAEARDALDRERTEGGADSTRSSTAPTRTCRTCSAPCGAEATWTPSPSATACSRAESSRGRSSRRCIARSSRRTPDSTRRASPRAHASNG
jgi:hypothetical protein